MKNNLVISYPMKKRGKNLAKVSVNEAINHEILIFLRNNNKLLTE